MILIILISALNVVAQTNVFPADGNVGIGITSPSSKLDVLGDIRARNGLKILNYQNVMLADFFYDSTIDQMYLYGYKSNSIFSIYTAGSRQFDITSAGNVGIGTSDPVSKLDVRGEINGINSLKIRDHGNYLKAEFSYDSVIDQMYLYGHKPSSMFSIYTGGVRRFDITAAGNVGIGIFNPAEKLAVNGNIRAHEIKLETANWPDYVFAEGFKLGTLEALETYIKGNKRLPDMPSASSIESAGLSVGEMVKLQQKKIEELTLHLIEQNRQIQQLKSKISSRKVRTIHK
ncbi:MAG: hypothetical protein EOO43_04420 [Flavobacterium sp.]|nr:MAG: hypothetical protein EOO43_04420 [Flavobacterium sp.]